jgi:hypothetical protein
LFCTAFIISCLLDSPAHCSPHTPTPTPTPTRRNGQNWPLQQTSAQNEPNLKLFHKITLFSSARNGGAMLSCIAPCSRVLSSWTRGVAGPASSTIAPEPRALCSYWAGPWVLRLSNANRGGSLVLPRKLRKFSTSI